MSIDYSSYKPKWRQRFEFFDANGGPGTAEYKQAFKALPFGRKVTQNINLWSLLCWPIHFLVLGLWRPMLSLLGLSFLIGIVLEVCGLSDGVGRPFGTAICVLAAMSANYLYYQKQVHGQHGWNPLAAWKKNGN